MPASHPPHPPHPQPSKTIPLRESNIWNEVGLPSRISQPRATKKKTCQKAGLFLFVIGHPRPVLRDRAGEEWPTLSLLFRNHVFRNRAAICWARLVRTRCRRCCKKQNNWNDSYLFFHFSGYYVLLCFLLLLFSIYCCCFRFAVVVFDFRRPSKNCLQFPFCVFCAFCEKNIRVIRAIRVQKKSAPSAKKIFVSFVQFVFKKNLRFLQKKYSCHSCNSCSKIKSAFSAIKNIRVIRLRCRSEDVPTSLSSVFSHNFAFSQ